MKRINLVIWSAVFGLALTGCQEPGESLSYCADVDAIDAQVTCMDDSFEFYQRLVDSTHSYVINALTEAELDANKGQQKKLARLRDAHLEDYDLVLVELTNLQIDIQTVLSKTDTVSDSQSSIESTESLASEAITAFEEKAEKTLAKL